MGINRSGWGEGVVSSKPLPTLLQPQMSVILRCVSLLTLFPELQPLPEKELNSLDVDFGNSRHLRSISVTYLQPVTAFQTIRRLVFCLETPLYQPHKPFCR